MVQRSLRLSDVVERVPDIIDAVAGDDVVMVSIDSGSYYGVTDVSREIWDALKAPVPIEGIVARLTRRYEVEPHVCETETLEFLNKMLDENLIRVVDGSVT
jgi:hypothetical protein